MITVNIITKGAELGIEQPTIADGTAGGMVAKFCTDSLWYGLALTAVFRTAVGDILMPLKNNECEVPFEATENCGEVLVGLFGTDGYRTLTSVFTKLNISPGTPTGGEEAKNYAPSLYEQFSARFERVENMTVTAETGQDASVVRSDSGNAVNLHFVIPKGDRGDKGIKGDKGDKGDRGEKGDKGDSYTLTEDDKKEIAKMSRTEIAVDGETLVFSEAMGATVDNDCFVI